jgi:hypothetical protein
LLTRQSSSTPIIGGTVGSIIGLLLLITVLIVFLIFIYICMKKKSRNLSHKPSRVHDKKQEYSSISLCKADDESTNDLVDSGRSNEYEESTLRNVDNMIYDENESKQPHELYESIDDKETTPLSPASIEVYEVLPYSNSEYSANPVYGEGTLYNEEQQAVPNPIYGGDTLYNEEQQVVPNPVYGDTLKRVENESMFYEL